MKANVSAQDKSYSDLDLPFEKLNVSYDNNEEDSRKETLKSADYHQPQSNTATSTKETISIHQKRLSNEDFEQVGRVYCSKKKRKQKSKSLLREAKLVLPIQNSSPENSTKKTSPSSKQKLKSSYRTRDLFDNSEEYCDCDNETYEKTNLSNTNIHQTAPVATCSTQYMNQQSHGGPSHEQTDSDQPPSNLNEHELASYFEQMLYIPKPMSLMAEMMYA
eukprot:TCONS_00001761-protein